MKIHDFTDRLGRHWGFRIGLWLSFSVLGRFEAFSLYVFRRRLLFRPIDYARYQ